MAYNAQVWGRKAWHFIHMVALSYPDSPTEENKKNYLNFFESLQDTLVCSVHIKENMQKNPPRLNSRKELFEWTVDIHNEVNRNKKEVISYQEAIKEIDKNSSQSSYDIAKGVLLSACVSTLLVIFSYKLAKRG
jgi:hypothetical protein